MDEVHDSARCNIKTERIIYNPKLTEIRLKNDQIRLDNERRLHQQRVLTNRLEKAERRVNEGHSMLTECSKVNGEIKRQIRKYTSQKSNYKRYLKTLATPDEFASLKSEIYNLTEENKLCTRKIGNVENRLKDFESRKAEQRKYINGISKKLENARAKIVEHENAPICPSDDAEDAEKLDILVAQRQQLAHKLTQKVDIRITSSQTYTQEREELNSRTKKLQYEYAVAAKTISILTKKRDELNQKLSECCSNSNTEEIKMSIAENIDTLDDLVKRIQSNRVIEDEDSDEDFNITHALQRDIKNQTFKELSDRLNEIGLAIQELGEQHAANACEFQ